MTNTDVVELLLKYKSILPNFLKSEIEQQIGL
jgi:hypothetical protein